MRPIMQLGRARVATGPLSRNDAAAGAPVVAYTVGVGPPPRLARGRRARARPDKRAPKQARDDSFFGART